MVVFIKFNANQETFTKQLAMINTYKVMLGITRVREKVVRLYSSNYQLIKLLVSKCLIAVNWLMNAAFAES